MGSAERGRVAVSQRVVPASGTTERRDVLDQGWADRLEADGLLAFPVPNRLSSVTGWLDALRPDAVLLSGGNTPVTEPGSTDADAAPERDALEVALIDEARRRRLPLLGVCRGAQMVNLHLGGSLSPVPDPAAHAGTVHSLRVADWLSPSALQTNSFHRFGLAPGDLAPELVAFAWSCDGWVEAFHHRSEAIAGLLWHPERPGSEAPALRDLFVALLAGQRPWPTAGDARAPFFAQEAPTS